jgi:lipoate-protein ligase A
MERDARLLAAAESDSFWTPLLRLFQFVPHGITIGRGQDPERALDLERVMRDGVPWAVRPTGGRSIFHGEEWTYSFTARIDDPAWGVSLPDAYERIADVIARSLVRLGVPADLAGARRATLRSEAGLRGPCFTATTRREIVLGGRKLVGSAQRRTARAWIQQGSVLLGPGQLRLTDYLPGNDADRAAARRLLELRSAHAGARLGTPPIERWADALEALLPRVRRVEGALDGRSLTGGQTFLYCTTALTPDVHPAAKEDP